MNDIKTPTIASVTPIRREEVELEEDFDSEVAQADPEMSDLAWIAKRIMLRILDQMDWASAAPLSAVLLDEGDQAIVAKFIAQAKIHVEMPAVPRAL